MWGGSIKLWRFLKVLFEAFSFNEPNKKKEKNIHGRGPHLQREPLLEQYAKQFHIKKICNLTLQHRHNDCQQSTSNALFTLWRCHLVGRLEVCGVFTLHGRSATGVVSLRDAPSACDGDQDIVIISYNKHTLEQTGIWEHFMTYANDTHTHSAWQRSFDSSSQ